MFLSAPKIEVLRVRLAQGRLDRVELLSGMRTGPSLGFYPSTSLLGCGVILPLVPRYLAFRGTGVKLGNGHWGTVENGELIFRWEAFCVPRFRSRLTFK